MMLKVMLVDDESLFREALRKTVPWQELGYEVICEAENGADALEKIQQFQPHVALVDINMPILDGIELAAEIKENGLGVSVVIITGYEEFAYARQAIEVGVENYLLKPIDDEQLAKVLVTVRKKKEAELEELKKQVKVYKPLLKEMLLSNLLQGTQPFALEQSRKLKDSLAVDPDAQPYLVIAIEISNGKQVGWDDDEKLLWTFAVSNMMRDILESECVYESCQDMERVCAVIHMKETAAGWPLEMDRICRTIRQSVMTYLKLDTTIGISELHEGLKSLPQAYREAVYALHNRHMAGENRVIRYGDAAFSNEAALRVYTLEQRRQLLMAARMNDAALVDGTLRAVFADMRKAGVSVELLVHKCAELVSTCLEFVEGTGRDVRSVFGDDSYLSQVLQERKPLDEWEARIKGVFRQAVHAAHSGAGPSSSRTVEHAIKYIDEHLGKFDLKIDEIARHVYIGYGRLCELFKKETGTTINGYITDARIRKAKKLIDEGHTSVSTVSALVGYADANYFGKSFKKKYGIAPGTYIENRLANK